MSGYNFVAFPVPKMARFKFTDYKTGDPRIEDVLIIGMDGERYVIRLQEHTVCYTDSPDYGKIIMLPIGIHESYFVCWLNLGFQASLF